MHGSSRHVCCLPALLLVAAALQAQPAAASVQAVRYWSFGDVTRIAVETQGAYTLHYAQLSSPPRVYFDLTGLQPPTGARHRIQTIPVNDDRIKDIRVDAVRPGTTRIVFDLKTPVEVVSSQLVNPDRLMIELRPKGTALAGLSIAHSVTKERKIDLTAAAGGKRPSAPLTGDGEQSSAPRKAGAYASSSVSASPVTVKPIDSATVLPPPPETHPTRPVAVPARAKAALQADGSLVRMFGLKIDKIVIDAGHGGHDTGAIGPDGLEEKDVVLDIALRLGKLIRRRLGAQVIYTRSTDVFVPLEERTKIANEAHADLFISIHANSSSHHSASGVETYYFNLTSDKHGLDVARRENAASTGSISQLHDLLHRAVLQTKLDESHQFAQCIQSYLWPMSRRMDRHSQNRGVRHAPFVVLIGATMPSILAEVGFISNRHDEKMLRRGSQRQKIAQALFKGIEEYADSLNHEQMASSADE